MKDITFLIHCWLNVENSILGVSRKEFTKRVRSKHWTKRRLDIFNKLTLPSLLNQNFDEFRILLFCGNRYKAITDNYNFDDPDNRLELVYDAGRHIYQNEIETPYVNIMRIDSDDMFRHDLMDIVRNKVRKTNKREAVVFRHVIQWNTIHQFISDFYIPRSPFTSHTFPKKIYKDWNELKKQQFMDYRSCPKEMAAGKVCIVRHQQNVTWKRLNWDTSKRDYRERERQKRNNFTENKTVMRETLKHFGVDPGMIK
jgi:hypothetical protein